MWWHAAGHGALTRDAVACLTQIMWRDVDEIVGISEN